MDVVGMPVLQVLLLTIIFLSLFVEIKTGGMGAGVLLGLVAAGVFFGSQYVKGLVELYQIGIFLGGLVCIMLEILLPTVGLLAGLGVAALLYSIVLTLGGDLNALYAMLISFVLAIAIFALLAKRLPSSKLWLRLTLRDKSTSERGYISAEERRDLVGKTGKTLTKLRPSGSMLIDGVPTDVVTEGDFVDKGADVKVVAVQGSRIVVRLVVSG